MLRQAQQPAQGPKRNARPETARALTPAYYIVQPSVKGWLSEMFYTTQDLLYARPAYYNESSLRGYYYFVVPYGFDSRTQHAVSLHTNTKLPLKAVRGSCIL